jgi:hypothetical protein
MRAFRTNSTRGFCTPSSSKVLESIEERNLDSKVTYSESIKRTFVIRM